MRESLFPKKQNTHDTLIANVYERMVNDMLKVNYTAPSSQQRYENQLHEIRQRIDWMHFHQSLAVICSVDPMIAEVLLLHCPEEKGKGWWFNRCEGCDWEGYEGEPPSWPCRTVRLISKLYNVEVPD